VIQGLIVGHRDFFADTEGEAETAMATGGWARLDQRNAANDDARRDVAGDVAVG
jgi:hypothetical protein